MRRATYFAVILLFCTPVAAQTSPNAANQELRRQLEIQARNEADLERRMREMRQLENKMIAISKRVGDVPIEQVSPAHPALSSLVRQMPSSDVPRAREMASELANGIAFGEYRYAAKVKATENTTYVVRSTAYRLGSSLPPLTNKTSMTEMRFHSLAHDKRADIVVFFRIIRRDDDGVTIVWKELDHKDAPKLKFAKGEPLADFNLEYKPANAIIK